MNYLKFSFIIAGAKPQEIISYIERVYHTGIDPKNYEIIVVDGGFVRGDNIRHITYKGTEAEKDQTAREVAAANAKYPHLVFLKN